MIKHFKFNPFGSIRRHQKYVEYFHYYFFVRFIFKNIIYSMYFSSVKFFFFKCCSSYDMRAKKKRRRKNTREGDSRLPNMISDSERQE